MRAWACSLAIALLLGGCLLHAHAPSTKSATDLRQTLDALAGLRTPDGRWPAGIEPYVVEAAARAHLDVARWPPGDPLANHLAAPPANASYLASLRPLYAMALGKLPRADLARAQHITQRVMQGFDGRQFGDARLLNDDAFALLVLAEDGVDFHEPAYAHVADALLANQTGGGWSWAVAGAPETDTTGMVLAALSPVPGAPGWVDARAAHDFLATTLAPDGGHSLIPEGAAQGNCDSTVWAIRAEAILGLPADEPGWAFLTSLRHADGSYSYAHGGPANALCTAEVATLLALAADGRIPRPE